MSGGLKCLRLSSVAGVRKENATERRGEAEMDEKRDLTNRGGGGLKPALRGGVFVFGARFLRQRLARLEKWCVKRDTGT